MSLLTPEQITTAQKTNLDILFGLDEHGRSKDSRNWFS